MSEPVALDPTPIRDDRCDAATGATPPGGRTDEPPAAMSAGTLAVPPTIAATGHARVVTR